MKGPSLIAYNSAKFSETDFKSIQRIGDSLKKDKNGTKTGRFGVGVNSTYHLTDVPMFASGTKVVMFDPQASFVPGINPANPGKMIDCSKTQGRNLVKSLPHVFDPLKVFGCNLSGEDFNGTMFRFALRTDDQAKVSRLSRQSHLLPATRDLLHQMASAAPLMLIFLKNVECIEIYDWKANNASPSMISRTAVGNASDKLRMRRSYVLNAPSRVPAKPQAVDYILDIETTGVDTAKTTERWMVCNQLGGGNASMMANDPALSHMKLVPWAGVAARISPSCEVDGGNAYCFLPLPVKTKLPIHVNGYFELSSNRRDVWWGDDMAGDGKARADWNRSIVRDIAAPSYIRLLTAAIRTKLVTQTTYEQLFPQKELSGPWKVLCDTFLNGLRDCPVLYSECSTVTDHWVAPSKSLLLHDEKDEKLSEILAFDKLLLVRFKSSELKSILLQHGTCKNTTTPELLRRYFSNRKERPNGCLEQENTKNEHAEYLLKYCKSDLSPTQYHNLSGCQFIPLASGDLGKFCTLPSYDQSGLAQLQVMGFSKLLCIHALRVSKDNVDTAMEWLLANRYSDEAVAVQYGVDPYLLCDKDSASLLRESAADTFVDLEHIIDPGLRKFFSSGVVSTTLNILPLRGDMLADIVSRAVPSDWRGNESAPWNSQREHPNVQWFVDLWRFICSCDDVGGSLKSVAEQFCIVPTGQGVVCSLSPGNSVVSADGLDDQVVQCLVRAGVRVLFPDVLPVDLVVPPEIYSYIFDTTRDGVIKAIDAASRRKNVGPESLERASDEMKDTFFQYFSSREYCPISTPCKVMLRHFPIFRAYRNNVMSTETTFVPMTRSRVWYVLEGATNDDCTFMTSDFLMASTPADIKLLTLLGAKKMSRSDFFKKVVIPQLSEVDLDVGDRVVERILLDLPSLSDTDHEFGEHLSTIKFIRSSDSKSLRSPSEVC
jgi:sacsin